MRTPIEVNAIAQEMWDTLVSATENTEERIFICGFLSGKSYSECLRAKREP